MAPVPQGDPRNTHGRGQLRAGSWLGGGLWDEEALTRKEEEGPAPRKTGRGEGGPLILASKKAGLAGCRIRRIALWHLTSHFTPSAFPSSFTFRCGGPLGPPRPYYPVSLYILTKSPGAAPWVVTLQTVIPLAPLQTAPVCGLPSSCFLPPNLSLIDWFILRC